LDAAYGAAGHFYVDHPELEEDALVNMISGLRNNHVAFTAAQLYSRRLRSGYPAGGIG
jgi:hypothetical protein